jgi:hypothetical protein
MCDDAYECWHRFWCWAGQHEMVQHVRQLARLSAGVKLVVLDVSVHAVPRP